MGLFKKKEKQVKPEEQVKDEKKSEDSKKDEKKSSMKDLYSGTAKTDNKKKEKQTPKKSNAYKILVKPLITEKASSLGVENKYVFTVSVKANKIEIANAVNEVYGVKPVDVNVINVKGKKSRYGRINGRRKDWKKAVVTLPEGKTIKVYEGV